MIRTRYIIAAYPGEGRHGGITPDIAKEFLKEHLELLANTPNRLTSVVVVTPIAMDLPVETIVRESNDGFSYGAFIDAFKQDTSFDHYILIEDDYVFVRPNFDRWLVEFLGIADMLCARALPIQREHHAAVFAGIMTKAAMMNVAERLEVVGSDYGVACNLQRAWAQTLKLIDWRPYSCAYWNTAQGFLRWFDDAEPTTPLVPLQALRRSVPCAISSDDRDLGPLDISCWAHVTRRGELVIGHHPWPRR